MLEPGDALRYERHPRSPPPASMVKRKKLEAMWNFSCSKILLEMREVLAKPAKRLKVGTRISFGDGRLSAVVTEELTHGGRIVRFEYHGIFLEVLESLENAAATLYPRKLDDRERYQTVYAKEKRLSCLHQLLDFTSPKNCWQKSKLRVFI